MVKKLFQILKYQQGTTLPEVMAGMMVMAILAGTGATSAVNQINRAKLIATMNEMKAISEALEQYQVDNPGETISTITTLVTKRYLKEGFIETPESELETDYKKDQWGTAYKLAPPSMAANGTYERGYLESAGQDRVFENNSATSFDESDDNIKISLEPMITSD